MQNITKSYNSSEGMITIFTDMSLSIPGGAFVAVMGPSGSGKSTLLNMISGLDDPNQGIISIGGNTISQLSDDAKTKRRGKNISFIFQAFHLLPHLTVEENINLSIQLNNIPRRYTTDVILEKVGLLHRRKAYPFTLSGGEQQRVAIARAFVGETPILLADEPTGNLDENTAKNIISLIKKLHQDTGTTIVMITHDDRIAAEAQVRYRLNNHSLHLID